MKTLATSEILANPNNVRKFRKCLDLATKTRYTVSMQNSYFLRGNGKARKKEIVRSEQICL